MEEVKNGIVEDENPYSNVRECYQGTSYVAKYDYKAGKDEHPLSFFLQMGPSSLILSLMYFV